MFFLLIQAMVIPSDWLRRLPRGHGSGGRERPETETGDFDIGHMRPEQLVGVEAGAVKVGNRHLAALLEGAHDFTDGFAASFAGGNVVDGEVGERGVKAAVGEGHFAHVSVMNADSLRDSSSAAFLSV